MKRIEEREFEAGEGNLVRRVRCSELPRDSSDHREGDGTAKALRAAWSCRNRLPAPSTKTGVSIRSLDDSPVPASLAVDAHPDRPLRTDERTTVRVVTENVIVHERPAVSSHPAIDPEETRDPVAQEGPKNLLLRSALDAGPPAMNPARFSSAMTRS